MSSLIRKTVSKKKRRYQKGGFDLDLSYITDKVIAMGFPSESVEGVYRNPFKEVFRFLELMHKDHYKVYNLCSERSYDISKFHNRVECFPFDDHNCPTMDLVMRFCANVKEWISAHEKNVVVVHCKAGKGRTGLMICCYLMYSKEWATSQEALDFYAAMRTYNKKGVTIPSQIRYVHYVGKVVNEHNYKLPEPKTALLKAVILSPPPKISDLVDVKFSAFVFKTLVYTHSEQPKLRGKKKKDTKKGGKDEEEEEALVFECAGVPLCGDIKLDFYTKDTFGSDRLMCFWFNTFFTDKETEFKKEEIDKAAKDKSCKVFKDNFKVTLQFEYLDNSADVSKTPGHLTKLGNGPLEISRSIAELTDKGLSDTDEEEPKGITLTNNNNEDDEYEEVPREPLELADILLSQLCDLKLQHDKMDVVALKSLGDFKLFEQSIYDLEEAMVSKLETSQEKHAFWINTYNLLMMHATIARRPAKGETVEQRFESLSKCKYNVGGSIYSILDIQFAILRSALPEPSHVPAAFSKKFASDDLRKAVVVDSKDPRLVFALCEGTMSSPALRIYHAASLFEELDEATRSYLQANITVDDETKTLHVPKLLDWYGKDLGKTIEKALKSLSGYLTDEQKKALSNSYTIAFKDYDWTVAFQIIQ